MYTRLNVTICFKTYRKLINTSYYSIVNELTIVNYRVEITQILFC